MKKVSRPAQHKRVREPITGKSSKPIPWDSPSLRPALLETLDRAYAAWAMAVDWAPQIVEAPIVAKTLDTLRDAARSQDRAMLSLMEEGVRRTRGETSKLGGRRPERAKALERLAAAMDRSLAVSSHFCQCRPCKVARNEPVAPMDLDVVCATPGRPGPMPALSAAQMASGFLTFVSHEEPLTHELKRLRLLPTNPLDLAARDEMIRLLEKAFQKALDALTEPDGQRLVTVGLRCLGYNTRNLFSFVRKRERRTPAKP